MKELLSIEDPIAGLLGAWSAGLNLGSALLRIALIVALAASIGCERSSKRHSAGLRTFVLAAFSATVSMLLDQYAPRSNVVVSLLRDGKTRQDITLVLDVMR